MTATSTATLAERASALTQLCTLASQLGGSIRVDNGAGTIYYGAPNANERPLGSNVFEAVSALSAERDRAVTAA